MKIVVTATSPNLDSPIDSRFGRAAYFVVVDTDTLDWQAYPNPGSEALGGAGTQAAQNIASRDIQVVLSGDFGPNAYIALNAAGIAMYLGGVSRTVREAVELLKTGQLSQADVPTSVGRRSQ